jgi:hypothetical protein
MTTPLQRLAAALVRFWTHAYTWGMEPHARDSRRAEIESDLWESLHDDGLSATAPEMIGRLIAGLLDDVRWRVEQPTLAPQRMRITFAVATVALLAAGVWIAFAGTPPPPPAPPAPELYDPHMRVRPPPPPPPPPPQMRRNEHSGAAPSQPQ